jgi:hypothetical protein
MLGVAGLGTLSRGEIGAAQLVGRRSGAVSFAPTDAAALGDSSLSAVGLSVGDYYTLGGGMGVGKGAIRGYIGAVPDQEWNALAAAAYARTLATRTLRGPLRGSIGTEIDAGFRYYARGLGNTGAVSLTMPVGTTLGNPSRASLGIYLAPYAETNLRRQQVGGCTQTCDYRLGGVGVSGAFGSGFGVRLSAGRISASALIRDILSTGPRVLRGDGDLTLGLSLRLGR